MDMFDAIRSGAKIYSFSMPFVSNKKISKSKIVHPFLCQPLTFARPPKKSKHFLTPSAASPQHQPSCRKLDSCATLTLTVRRLRFFDYDISPIRLPNNKICSKFARRSRTKIDFMRVNISRLSPLGKNRESRFFLLHCPHY